MKYRILIFAGTTESRIIAEHLKDSPAELYLSVATEYGRESFGMIEHARIIDGRMDTAEMMAFIKNHEINVVVDATHPFAQIVTVNIRSACDQTGSEYIRCLRDASADLPPADSGQIVYASSIKEAAEYLRGTEGNVFISTGSKELFYYTELEGYRERCYVRVLSTLEAVAASIDLGFSGLHLFAMQGPYSCEMNVAMLRQTGAKYFVTKDSGVSGGLSEKITAARETGSTLIIVTRSEELGMDVNQVCAYLERKVQNGS